MRELLLLAAVFAGSYFWEAANGDSGVANDHHERLSVLPRSLWRHFVAALIEVALSFNRFPFTYGQRCFEVRPLAKDGWTRGVLRVQVPPEAANAELTVLAERPDLYRRPLDLTFSPEREARHCANGTTCVHRTDSEPRRASTGLPDSLDGKRLFEVKPSHCYVPLNLGITYDPRRLGVRVKELRFLTAAHGDEVKLAMHTCSDCATRALDFRSPGESDAQVVNRRATRREFLRNDRLGAWPLRKAVKWNRAG